MRRTHFIVVAVLAFAVAATTSSPGHAQEGGGEGSGQFTGLSTAPEANFFSGSMSTSVPIQVPKGRQNATPQLQLSYSSGGGSGPFGYGWDLPLGSIERNTKHGRPRCGGDHVRDFVLMLSGSSMELVKEGSVSQAAPNVFLYRTKVDESYLEAIGNEEDEHSEYNTWTVRDRAGMAYQFGYDAGARVFHNQDRVITEDPPLQLCDFTSIWGLTQMKDANGNTIDISYFKDQNTLYPDEILYGANPGAGLVEHPFKVVFKRATRSSKGAGTIEQSHRGVSEKLAHVIDRIEVFYKPQRGADYTIVRAYDLSYEYRPENGRLLLASVDDDDSLAGDLIPAQSFTYASSSFDHDTSASYSPPPSLNNSKVHLQDHFLGFSFSKYGISSTYRSMIDMNGDGLLDLVVSNPGDTFWRVYPGRADPMGFSPSPFNWPKGPAWTDNGRIQRSQSDANHSWVHEDTFDITGDGIPDFVDATNAPWTVYKGVCTGPTTCSFTGGELDWAAPVQYIQKSTDSGSTLHRVIDVSGDGLPDLVVGVQAYLNTGTGFEAEYDADIDVQTVSQSSGGGAPSTVTRDFFDFNGDGLPDSLESEFSSRIKVRLNSGRGFGTQINLTVAADANAIRATTGGADQETYLDFTDVNGDGLPDRVRQVGDQWYVQLNRAGTGLGAEVLWHNDLGPVRRTTQDVDPEDGETFSYTKTALVDFNGDGFVDRVQANGLNQDWTVHLGKPSASSNKPLLLETAKNGLGGVTHVSYAPSSTFSHTSAGADSAYDLPFNTWVVTQITRGDGLGVEPDTSQTVSYEGGFFERAMREFRGFRTVTRTDQDLNQRQVRYHQGVYDRGKVEWDRQYVGSVSPANLMREETFVWTHQVPNEINPDPACTNDSTLRHQVYLAEHKVRELSRIGMASLDRCVLTRNEPPDYWGRVSHTCSLACDGAPATPGSCAQPPVGQVDTETIWADPTVSGNFFLRERPLEVKTSHVDAPGSSTLLSEKRFHYDGVGLQWEYDGLDHDSGFHPYDAYNPEDPQSCAPVGEVQRGNLKRVLTRLEEGVDEWATTRNYYDSYGNISWVSDHMLKLSTSTYDDNLFSLYPVTETNALQQSVHRVTDLRYGQPIQVTGINDEISQAGYDRLGRKLCEAKPGQQVPRPAGDPSGCDLSQPFNYAAQYRYYDGDPAASAFASMDGGSPGKLSWVEVRTLEPNAGGSGFLVARQYTDGVGRKRLATTQRVVGAGATLSTVIVDHVELGTGGRVVEKYVPYVLQGAIAATPSGVASTTYAYGLNGDGTIDPQGRPHEVTGPDGRRGLSFYEGLRTRAVSAAGTALASETWAVEDDFGRVVLKEIYAGEGTGATLETYFVNTHDGMGRVLTETVSGDSDTLVTHTYDLWGREVMLYDPDAGTWESKFDMNGNMTYRDDPETGQHVQWLYDALGRVTHVCVFTDGDDEVALTNNCGSGTAESVYTYDGIAGGNKGVGRLTHVIDQSGSESSVYDERGRVKDYTRVIRGVAATMHYAYDDTDRIASVTYPDGEVVSYTYKPDGQLNSFGSSERIYFTSIHYDRFGRPQKISHGNGVQDSRTFHDYEENFRLAGIESKRGSNALLSLGYEYNDLGKVSHIDDDRNSSGPLSNEADYTYDALGRLTTFNWLANPSTQDEHDDQFLYDDIGNITQKGGQALLYGSGQVDCDEDAVNAPHQVASYGGKCFSYDKSGRRTQKGTGSDSQAYAYDALDRLTRIDFGNGEFVEYEYAYSGQRTAKSVNGEPWTLYFSEAVESEVDENGDGWLTKYYFAGDKRIANFRYENDDFVDAAFVTPDPLTIPPWAWALFGFAVVVLLLGPGKQELRLGIMVGPAQALGVSLLIFLAPAMMGARCGPPQTVDDGTKHYHFDHLGSTQAVTDGKGVLIQQVRYAPYGEVRGRFDGNGAALGNDSDYRHEFTGYETEFESGLMYAGARYFDPETAQFLSHDPEQQYASPYAYGPGDPMNGTDPDGRFFGIASALFSLASVLFAVGYQAYKATGSVTEGFKAAGMFAASLAAGVVVGIALPAIAGAAVGAIVSEAAGAVAALSVKVAMVGYGAYGTAQSARNGDYVGAIIGAASLAVAAKGIASDFQGLRTSSAVGGGNVGATDDLAGLPQVAGGDDELAFRTLENVRADQAAKGQAGREAARAATKAAEWGTQRITDARLDGLVHEAIGTSGKYPSGMDVGAYKHYKFQVDPGTGVRGTVGGHLDIFQVAPGAAAPAPGSIPHIRAAPGAGQSWGFGPNPKPVWIRSQQRIGPTGRYPAR